MTHHRGYQVAFALTVVASLWSGIADANPTYSPSVRAAAAWKWNPPPGWIRHYLGDDRYKIAGKVWKLVSTPNDTQSYPAWAPEMLARPAANVIGFSSVEDAVEAGYPPSGKYGSAFPDYVARGNAANSADTVNQSKSAIRITLADHRSTVLLPPNWRRTQSGASTIVGRSGNEDTLQPINGGGSIRFSFLNGTLDFGKIFTPESIRTFFVRLLQSSGNAQDQDALNNIEIGSANVGGIRGVLLSAKKGTVVPGITGRVAMAGRGHKAYMVTNNAQGVPGANAILNSFHAR